MGSCLSPVSVDHPTKLDTQACHPITTAQRFIFNKVGECSISETSQDCQASIAPTSAFNIYSRPSQVIQSLPGASENGCNSKSVETRADRLQACCFFVYERESIHYKVPFLDDVSQSSILQRRYDAKFASLPVLPQFNGSVGGPSTFKSAYASCSEKPKSMPAFERMNNLGPLEIMIRDKQD